MADQSLPRKAREARRRHKELSRRMHENSAAQDDRLQDIRKKFDTAVEREDARLLREALDAVGEEIAELKECAVEFDTISEELVAVALEASIEGSRLRSEALKHQATLAAGAIAGTAAITQVVMPQPLNATTWLGLTYLVLLLTVCLSVVLMHIEARRAERVLRTGAQPTSGWIWRGFYIASVGGLPMAVVLFIVFQYFNVNCR